MVTIEHKCIHFGKSHAHKLEGEKITITKMLCPYYSKGQSDSCGKQCFSIKSLREYQAKPREYGISQIAQDAKRDMATGKAVESAVAEATA